MFDLEEAITVRHSKRMFLPQQPVARVLVEKALPLAVHAPSNSNIQPWHMVFASGPANGCRGGRSQGTGASHCDSLPAGLDPVALGGPARWERQSARYRTGRRGGD